MRKQLLVSAPLIGLLTSASAIAAPTSCTTILSDKTIDGDLIVPAGKGCELDGVTVIGNVHVGIGASFFTQISSAGRTIILGNVIADNCADIAWAPSVYISGNVQIVGCAGPSYVQVTGTITGNVACLNNPASCEIENATVGGDLQVNNNSGGATVTGNYVGGNLQSVGNASGALTVSGNHVAGTRQGQCSGAGQ